MSFEFERTFLPDIIVVKPKVFYDERGFFLESFRKEEFEKNGINFDFVQDNISFSKKGVIRGLHYQLHPRAQGKLVKCIKGKILDVAVDIRINSPFYKKFVAIELSTDNNFMLFIPPGFAHGFLALEDSFVLYKTTDYYSKEHDTGIIYNDKEINIKWPIDSPILSEKDRKLPPLKEAKNNFYYGENS